VWDPCVSMGCLPLDVVVHPAGRPASCSRCVEARLSGLRSVLDKAGWLPWPVPLG
jgi:hypothetical protein